MTFPQQRKFMKNWAYVTFFSLIWRFDWCFDEYSRSSRRGGDTFASCVCLLYQGSTYSGRSNQTNMMESFWKLYTRTQFWTLNPKKMVAESVRSYQKWKSSNLEEKSPFFNFVLTLLLARFFTENALRKCCRHDYPDQFFKLYPTMHNQRQYLICSTFALAAPYTLLYTEILVKWL